MFILPETSLRQCETPGRVMHEFAHGELKRGRGGKVIPNLEPT
jgi:hypothetical protein